MKKRYKFTPDQWVIFDYQGGNIAIGYTGYRDSVPVIRYASDRGQTGEMLYDKVVNPRRLCIESREANNIRKSAEMLPNEIINLLNARSKPS